MKRLWVYCAIGAALGASWVAGGCSHVPAGTAEDSDDSDQDSGSATEAAPSTAAVDATGSADSPSGTVLWALDRSRMYVRARPVADKEGNIYAGVILIHHSPDEEGADLPEDVRVISLSPDGRERWRSEPLCPNDGLIPYSLNIAADDDAVYVQTDCAGLAKFDLMGNTLWTISKGFVTEAGMAIGPDGTVYVCDVIRTAMDDRRRFAYSAVDKDGAVRWTTVVGIVVDRGNVDMYMPVDPYTHFEEAFPVVVGDHVYVPCDTCAHDRHGIASLDPATGTPTLVLSRPGSPASYSFGSLRAGVDTVYWYEGGYLYGYNQALNSATFSDANGFIGKIDAAGPVYSVGDETSWKIVWGDNVVPVPPGEYEYGVGVLALLDPDVLLLTSGQAVDRHGNVLFAIPDLGINIPVNFLAGDGYIVYVNDSYQLVAMEAPVTGLRKDAPWPTTTGNAQGNHRVE